MEASSVKKFNKAFAEFQQFGPRRRMPIELRWAEMFPDIDSAHVSSMKSQCEDIQAFACELAERVKDKKLTDAIARTELAQKYVFLAQDRLNVTWSQALYFSHQ